MQVVEITQKVSKSMPIDLLFLNYIRWIYKTHLILTCLVDSIMEVTLYNLKQLRIDRTIKTLTRHNKNTKKS